MDYIDKFGVVATTGQDERFVGHALYARLSEDRAEVAFAIADEAQGQGLGTILLGQLAEVAAANKIQVFEAEVLSANHQMLDVFRQSGFPIDVQIEVGQFHVSFPTSLTPEAIERFEMRERTSSVNALKLFFNPRAVAVIGASRHRGSIGGELFHNLLNYGFAGPVYPVNPLAEVIQCVPAYPSVEAIPGPVDLVVIVVPAEHVIAAAEACGRKGVRALVVISAGFGETGEEGKGAARGIAARLSRDRDALDRAELHGHSEHGSGGALARDICATLAARGPRRVFIAERARSVWRSLITRKTSASASPLSFPSANKTDISGNDLLRYWEEDPNTDMILLYLESFGNPKKFSQIARRLGRTKPIAAVKSGRSTAGARATSSHTGALLAASDVTVDALFRQAGVIRTNTLEELFDVATLLVNQPPPKGRRVGIITNAGGPAILCADACEAEGLEVPVLGDAARASLRAFLPREASATNPVDMIASASADHYREAIKVVAADPSVDALIVIFTPPLVTRSEDVARAIVESVRRINRSKPVLTVFMSARGEPEELKSTDVRIPSYAFPESAAIALARAARYGEWRERPSTAPPEFADVRRDEAAAIVAKALTRGEGWLTAEETAELLSCYGLPLVEQRTVSSAEDAAQAADRHAKRSGLESYRARLAAQNRDGRSGAQPARRAAGASGRARDVRTSRLAQLLAERFCRAAPDPEGRRDDRRHRARSAIRPGRGLRRGRRHGRVVARCFSAPDAPDPRRCLRDDPQFEDLSAAHRLSRLTRVRHGGAGGWAAARECDG